MVEQPVGTVVRPVQNRHAVRHAYLQAGIQGVYAHGHVLVAPAVLECVRVEYALLHAVGGLLELRELPQPPLGEPEVAAPSDHAGEHQVQPFAERSGLVPRLHGAGHHAEVGVVDRGPGVEVVHVGGEEVGRRSLQPGYVRVGTGAEHEAVLGEKRGVGLEEVVAYGGTVPVHEHDRVVGGLEERLDDRVAVPAPSNELLRVVEGDDVVRVSWELPERLGVRKHVYGGRGKALFHEHPYGLPHDGVLVVVR